MKYEVTFKTSNGAGFSNEEAATYGVEIERLIQEKGGQITPPEIVESASVKDSPLHDYFEWEDADAAIRWRIFQARNLMNHLKIEVRKNGDVSEHKAFYSVITGEREGNVVKAYVTIGRVINEEDIRVQVIEQALREMIGWKQRYKDYQELAEIFKAVRIVQKKLKFKEK